MYKIWSLFNNHKHEIKPFHRINNRNLNWCGLVCCWMVETAMMSLFGIKLNLRYWLLIVLFFFPGLMVTEKCMGLPLFQKCHIAHKYCQFQITLLLLFIFVYIFNYCCTLFWLLSENCIFSHINSYNITSVSWLSWILTNNYDVK